MIGFFESVQNKLIGPPGLITIHSTLMPKLSAYRGLINAYQMSNLSLVASWFQKCKPEGVQHINLVSLCLSMLLQVLICDHLNLVG
jgi:hypothetical protein